MEVILDRNLSRVPPNLISQRFRGTAISVLFEQLRQYNALFPLYWNLEFQSSSSNLNLFKSLELDFYDRTSVGVFDRAFSPHAYLESVMKSKKSYKDVGLLAIDSIYESSCQVYAINILGSRYANGLFVQVGGNGTHAIKHLLLGDGRSVLVTPSVGEALFAIVEAFRLGVLDRFDCVLGFGEVLPLNSNSVDVVYYGGSLHHTYFPDALSEATRVAKPEGAVLALEALNLRAIRLRPEY